MRHRIIHHWRINAFTRFLVCTPTPLARPRQAVGLFLRGCFSHDLGDHHSLGDILEQPFTNRPEGEGTSRRRATSGPTKIVPASANPAILAATLTIEPKAVYVPRPPVVPSNFDSPTDATPLNGLAQDFFLALSSIGTT
jgi:hypothetical protein